MTPQEVFDKVARHLLTQNKKSLSLAEICYYRAADGSKCAIGCLIPDEIYSPRMEGKTIRRLCTDPDAVSFFKELRPMVPLLEDLQEVHDLRRVADWPAQLNLVALAHNLSPLELST